MGRTTRILWGPITCVLLLSICQLGQAEVKFKTQRRFLEEILQEYDVNVWPGGELDDQEPTVVRVQVFINSFGSLNAANMDYSIDVFLRQRWNDHRLQLTENRTRVTILNQDIQKQIWKPDTYFNNVKDATVHKVTMPNILLRIDRNGDILYSMRLTLKLACNMRLEEFPFDEQSCSITMASYANTDDVIIYEWDPDLPIDMPADLEIAQFDHLKERRVTESDKQVYVTGNFSSLKVSFYLRRQNGFHILQTYIPTILIVVISWVSFWLDPKTAVPGRVSLGVTTLLTLTTLASGSRAQLPPVSYVKAIDVWIGMCMIMVFGALLEFTFVNWLANKKMVGRGSLAFRIPLALFGSNEEENIEAAATDPKEPQNYYSHALAIDRLCRGFFPGAFLIFNLIYWPYYLMRMHTPEIMEDLNASV